MVKGLELVEELEAAAAPSPSDALLELAGLRTATRLTQLTYECDEGRVTVSEYVTLKNQHDAAADVCRICHGPGTVRPAEGDDETGVRLLRDTCLCRGSIGCVHEECLVRWYETAGLPPDPRCPTCRGQFRNEGGLVLSQPVWKSTSASGGRDDSARTRRKPLISTQVATTRGPQTRSGGATHDARDAYGSRTTPPRRDHRGDGALAPLRL